jgi:hypothetical protein
MCVCFFLFFLLIQALSYSSLHITYI